MAKPKPGWRKIFLEELAKWGVVEHACAVAGVARTTAYRARDANPSFAAEWDEAKGKIVGTLEVLARQRASVGEQKPVYFQGKKVDTIREVDNVGLRWLLAHLKPEVYGEKLILGGDKENPIQHNVTHDLSALSTDDLKALVRIQRVLANNGNGSGSG